MTDGQSTKNKSERIMKKMIILSNSHVIAYVNGTSHIIGEMFVDDISELPSPTGIDGYELIQGSVAYVIKSGGIYILGSDGKWYDTDGEQV